MLQQLADRSRRALSNGRAWIVYRVSELRRWKRGLWIGGVILALGVVLLLIRIGFTHSWVGFTGFGHHKVKEGVQPAKTLWNWLDLLIVPIVLAVGGYLFTRSENRAAHAAAERRALDDTLRAYLDGMSELVTDKEWPLHSAQPGDRRSTLARARTLTVLSRLDGGRKRSVLEFLYESRLIAREQVLLDESDLITRRHNIISLRQANLSEADLSVVRLRRADLREVTLNEAVMYGTDLIEATLRDADLRKAFLRRADLSRADMYSANLIEANLYGATLISADLSEAFLISADLSEADLSMATLYRANLCGADLNGTRLDEADLSYAYLNEARRWTEKQLWSAKSLEGATMPNGQKYEDWLKDKKAREEDGQNESS